MRRVRIIDETGKNLGIFDLEKAIELAKQKGLDLIQVTERIDPPVCKIGNYGKYQYLKEKKEKKIEKQKKGELKKIRLGFNISLHDLETKTQLAGKFLKKGDKVRIEMILKGRERALEGFARNKINKFLEIVQNSIPIKIEKELKKEFNKLTMIISRS